MFCLCFDDEAFVERGLALVLTVHCRSPLLTLYARQGNHDSRFFGSRALGSIPSAVFSTFTRPNPLDILNSARYTQTNLTIFSALLNQHFRTPSTLVGNFPLLLAPPMRFSNAHEVVLYFRSSWLFVYYFNLYHRIQAAIHYSLTSFHRWSAVSSFYAFGVSDPLYSSRADLEYSPWLCFVFCTTWPPYRKHILRGVSFRFPFILLCFFFLSSFPIHRRFFFLLLFPPSFFCPSIFFPSVFSFLELPSKRVCSRTVDLWAHCEPLVNDCGIVFVTGQFNVRRQINQQTSHSCLARVRHGYIHVPLFVLLVSPHKCHDHCSTAQLPPPSCLPSET